MDAIFGFEPENNKDNTNKYRSIIDNNISVIDDSGKIIEANTISSDEIPDIVEQYLNELDVNSIETVSYKDIIPKLGVSSGNLYMTTSSSIRFELISLEEFVRYIRSEEVSKLFIANTDESEDYTYEIDYYTKKKLTKYDCDLSDIELLISNFIRQNNIQINTFSFSTMSGVGITYKADISFLNKVTSILRTCVRMLEEQNEAEKLEIYEAALNELPRLLEYVTNDSEYKQCTNNTKRKNYKSQGKFLSLSEFENIKEMVDNKPVINTEEYIKFRSFYVQYDALFDIAKDIISSRAKH